MPGSNSQPCGNGNSCVSNLLVSVTIAGRQVATQIIRGGQLKFDIENGTGLIILDARIGEILTIEYGNEILVSGEFQYDKSNFYR